MSLTRDQRRFLRPFLKSMKGEGTGSLNIKEVSKDTDVDLEGGNFVNRLEKLGFLEESTTQGHWHITPEGEKALKCWLFRPASVLAILAITIIGGLIVGLILHLLLG